MGMYGGKIIRLRRAKSKCLVSLAPDKWNAKSAHPL